MIVRMFQPRFARLVETGLKRQTIRKRPKLPEESQPRSGVTASLREWTGKAYRSPQRVLREVILTRVLPVVVDQHSLYVDGEFIGAADRAHFARADGFADWQELADWFADTHGLPFTGIALFW